MLFLLQAETIQTILNTPIFSEQGFIHRILLTQCDYYDKPDWEFTIEAELKRQEAKSKLSAFHSKISKMMHTVVKMLPNKNFEMDLPIMRQTEQAHIILGTWRNTGKNRAIDDLKNYAGFAERLHEHAIRLAATIAAFQGSNMLLEEHALCAIDLMEYYIEQRRRLEIGVSDWNPNRSAGANKLKEWLQEKTWSGSKRELVQFGPTWYRKLNVEQRDEILADLLRDEIIKIEEAIASNGRKVSIISLC
jgi:DNA replicative helicase MCM subunit Mcm2 (Cdc46/Mcm family)